MSLDPNISGSAVEISALAALNERLRELLELSVEERDAWFLLNDRSTTEMVRLRALLKEHDRGTSTFLNQSVALDRVVDELDHVLDDQEGDVVGGYRLLRKIGAGGMGTVWLAERDDQTLKRRVALKLPLVSWNRELLSRTRRERDILASLEHPNIARLYDGGVTPQGRPYLVMAFIDGQNIDTYCDAHALDIRARLQLFLQVCDAFSYAHSRLVVHGDPKPSNVLVTASATVHLLDFGVAKLLSAERDAAEDALVVATSSGETTRMTRTPSRAHTPDYASPEQIRGLPIGVASDIYSLGILLFELLVGKRPYRLRRTTDAAIEEAVLQGDLPLASALAPREHVRVLRGDLDSILAKATAQNSVQRYTSIEAFAADIRCYLSNEPVQARSVGRWYSAIKFVQRHAVGVTAATVVTVSLIVAVGISTWHWRDARQQQESALLQLENSESVLEFVDTVLTNGLRLDEEITLAQLLERIERIAERFTGDSEQVRLAAIDRITSWYASYGAHEKVIALIDGVDKQSAFASRSNVYGTLECRRAYAFAAQGQYQRAVLMLDRAIEEYANDAIALTNCLNTRGRVARDVNDVALAVAMARRTLDVFDRSGQRSPINRAIFVNDLAHALALSGDMNQSDALFAESIATLKSLRRDRGPEAMAAYAGWGANLASAGNPLRALEKLQLARAIALENTPIGHEPHATTLNMVAVLIMLNRDQVAVPALNAFLSQTRAGIGPLQLASAQIARARIFIRSGNPNSTDSAGLLLDEAEQSLSAKSLPEATPIMLRLSLVRGQWHVARNETDRAMIAFTTAIEASERIPYKTSSLSSLLIERADLLLKIGDLAAAQRDAERAVEIAEAARGSLSHSVFVGRALLSLAMIQGNLHQRADARSTASRALLHLDLTLDAEDPLIARARLAATL